MFRLEITLGNDAAQSRDEVAGMLERVARRLNDGWSNGEILDENGNLVGSWSYQEVS